METIADLLAGLSVSLLGGNGTVLIWLDEPECPKDLIN